MTRTTLALLLTASLVLGPGVALAVEDPNFDAYVPEPTLQPGGPAQVSVQLVNDANDASEQARTASNVRVTMNAGDTPISVNSGTRVVGSMPDGAVRQLAFSVDVPRNVSAGTYRLPLTVEYEHSGDETDTQTVYATVRVKERARFEVVDSSMDASIGDTGTTSLTLKHVGESVATDTRVTVQSGSADVRFGQSASASRFVGQWEPGETRTVEYEATVASGADRREYALQATVAYDDENGTAHQYGPLAAGVRPAAKQSFALSNVQADLRAGEEGSVTATVVNEGPKTARDAVVVFTTQNPNVNALETEYALGDLGPNETAEFSLPVEVSGSAEAGPRQFSYRVEYRNHDGETRQSDALTARVEVAESRDVFAVEPTDATLSAGGSDTVTLTVTNQGDETVRNVRAKAFASDPLSVNDDEAYVQSLEPGESTEITFGVGAAGSALAKTYVLEMDVQYEDADGDTRLSDTYQAPVEVTRSDGDGTPLSVIVGGVAVLAIAAVGGWVWFRG
jgi:hypothetical protein